MSMILDWNQYTNKAMEVAAEGCVLLENKGSLLPLDKDTRVSVFGRMQEHYYKSGTGSGGMVNVTKNYSILEGLREDGSLKVNEELVAVYEAWSKEHPIDEGEGWGNEPWSQEEMPLSMDICQKAARESDVAVVILARTAGEDKDAADEEGSYRLTQTERQMLKLVRACFEKMVVLLNVGSIIDMSFVDEIHPESLVYLWQGGMIGGLAAVKILTGEVNPSGHLPDSIAYHIEDYPSSAYFGNEVRDFYVEDIYVGYRYFTTFKPEAVRYPFGYGLSYTSFSVEMMGATAMEENLMGSVKVTNIGEVPGKTVVQLYMQAPQGNLGRPARILLDYGKTSLLAPGQSEVIEFDVPLENLATYDDSGYSGHKNCWVLEEGEYTFYAGENVADVRPLGRMELITTRVMKTCEEALAPVLAFERIRPVATESGYDLGYVEVPLSTKDMDERRKERLPKEIKQTGNQGILLKDVRDGHATMEAFIAQLSDEDLSCIVRGEGMGSSLVTPGTAAAFGGVSANLRNYGIPACCCDDGPSGMRLDCGTKAFNIPNGTLLASTFNPELVTQLFTMLGYEMVANKVDALLGPGINIHRHPLNGRNFEYFSEDPYVTGSMACAVLRGLKSAGVSGTLKHYAGNNQEYKRREIDSVISQRALREIYLKAFEMAVKDGNADSIMTTYGSLNGLWTAGSYDLNTTILRKDWGYTGLVMTDWWAAINERNGQPSGTNFAAMVRAQNDIYMVCPHGDRNASGDNTLESLAAGSLARSELQQCAMNTCRFAMHSLAMKRLLGEDEKVEIINRVSDEEEIDLSNVEYIVLEDYYEKELTDKESKKGTSYLIPLDVTKLGVYELELYASSELGEVAQIPCTLFYTGIPVAVMTFHGTKGATDVISKQVICPNRFAILRLYVGGNGLQLQKLTLRYVREMQPGDIWL